jgi:hypothetical protein
MMKGQIFIIDTLGSGIEENCILLNNKSFLDPGQTYFFSPKPDTNITTVKVSTNEGIVVQSDYRSPTKALGLLGSGR